MQKILLFLRAHWIRIVLVVCVALVIGVRAYMTHTAAPNWIQGAVERGTVSNIISVSGTMNATQNANLSFPIGGIVDTITTAEGANVTQGTVLATLRHNALLAERTDALAALRIAEADQQELMTGIRPEKADVVRTKVAIAQEELAQVTKIENEKVTYAYRTLLSSNLIAKPEDKDTEDTAPTISGTYTCDAGVYTLDVFSSGADSGYSFRISGLESGTYTAYTESAGPLGTCGLAIQFDPDSSYGNSTWTITIPNTESTSYVTNNNAYLLARTTRDNAIASAKQALTLAEQTEVLDTARPRSEELTRSEARIMQAQARVAKIEAQIAEHILTAPFEGTITHIDAVPGETVGTEPIVTMVSKSIFELTALIPEIDVTKVQVGQQAQVVFDARTEETLDAHITFISPLAREIGGVSYFETKLALDTQVTWLQSGLNADIDIIIDTRSDVLRISKRFLVTEGDAHFVLLPEGKTTTRTPVTVLFEGNDGYVEVGGLREGDTVIAP